MAARIAVIRFARPASSARWATRAARRSNAGSQSQPADRVERQVELAIEQDLLQLLEVLVAVDAIACGGPLGRAQQPDRVVVMERPDADAREGRQLTDGVGGHLARESRP